MPGKELPVRFKHNLVISYLNGEGIALDLDMRKTYWINETGAFLLRLLEVNHEGVFLSSAKSLLQERYPDTNRSEVTLDLASFINDLEWYGLISYESATSVIVFKNLNGKARKPYLRPMIEENTDIVSLGGNLIGLSSSHAVAASQA